jgi:hypothetical protein
MAWTTITNPEIAPGAAGTTALFTALRDNTIASQGAMKHLADATISSDATVDFTAFDNTIYRSYKFVFENVLNATSAADFEMLFSTDGGATFQTSYDYRGIFAGGGGVTAPSGNGASQILLMSDLDKSGATTFGTSGTVEIIGAASSTRTSFTSQMAGKNISGITLLASTQLTSGWSRSATDTDAVRFQMSAGNMTSGTIHMYGILAALEAA